MTNYPQTIDKSSDQHWHDIAKRLRWIKPYQDLKKISFHKPVEIKWYLQGQLNVSDNCLDRHAETHPEKIALIWEPDNPHELALKITYKELLQKVCRLALVLKKLGIQKGDCVTIYLPMIPEAAIAMLACARIGAVHSVVFAGFSSDSLADRINDSQSKLVITADEGLRAGKKIPLKNNVDRALLKTPSVQKTLVFRRTHAKVSVHQNDIDYETAINQSGDFCEPEVMDSEDPLFILYTSGSTGKPKGVLHTTAGYLAYASYTHEKVFQYQPSDIYWCTADVGWITGHSYIVYGPLSNGATTLMFEGVPNYPDASRFWQVIDKHQVNIFYTAPTAIRALMREGLTPLQSTSRKSLKVLGSVGEPINPEAWLWYSKNIGHDRCPVVDTWWQTETGGILISAIAFETKLKPGSASLPLPEISVKVISQDGSILNGESEGLLVLDQSWPGQMRTIINDHQRFEETYFTAYPGYYFTGDGCKRDADGYYWITGRVDDVINVSGHRIGTAEIESSLVGYTDVAEAAVVGFSHDIKGQGIYAFVTLKNSIQEKVDQDLDFSQSLKVELIKWVREQISPIATPDHIQWASQLPKTRSGKIMRRLLRKIAENQIDDLGDTSTLLDPQVVDQLIKGRN